MTATAEMHRLWREAFIASAGHGPHKARDCANAAIVEVFPDLRWVPALAESISILGEYRRCSNCDGPAFRRVVRLGNAYSWSCTPPSCSYNCDATQQAAWEAGRDRREARR